MSNVGIAEFETSTLGPLFIDLDNYDSCNYILIDCSLNNVIMETTTTLFDGYYFTIIRTDNSSNTLTINSKSGQSINGTTSFIMPERSYLEMVGFNNNWKCINLPLL
jgi:hypothetical protein